MIDTLLHLRFRDLGVYFLYDCVVYFGGSEAPFLYMKFMYYDTTFLDLYFNEKYFMMTGYFIYMCKCVCDCIIVCETNANLVHNLHMNQQID